MAGEMLQQQAQAATQDHAGTFHGHAGHPGHDCMDHAAPHAHTGDDAQQAQPQGDTHAPTCASCQVCSSVALGPLLFLPPVATFSHPRPIAAPHDYTSAEPALAFKPPRG